MKIEYVEVSEYMIKPPAFEYGRNIDGYGKKIVTRYMIKPQGADRFYRVYATCWGNCASLWVTIKGQRYHLYDTAFDVAKEVTK